MPARTRSTGGAVREEVDRLERDRDRDEAAAGDHARRAAARVFEPATPDATRTPAASWTVVDVGDDAEDRASTDPPAPESAASMSARCIDRSDSAWRQNVQPNCRKKTRSVGPCNVNSESVSPVLIVADRMASTREG